MKDSTMRFLSDKAFNFRWTITVKYITYTPHSHFFISHSIHNSGACVWLAEEQEVSIDTLTLEQLQKIDSRFEEDVLKVWDYNLSVERKSSIGGTSKARVLEQIENCIAFSKTL